MKVLEFISKIPHPDIDVIVYSKGKIELIDTTIFKLHIYLRKLKNKRINSLEPIDYLLKYSNISTIQIYSDYIYITLEDTLEIE